MIQIYRGCSIEGGEADGYRWYRNSNCGGNCLSIEDCKEQIDWYLDEE